MPITKQLYELQELDTDIEHTSQTLVLKTGQLGKRDTLDAAQNALTSEQNHLAELKHARKDTEFQVDDILNKIAVAEKQLYGGTVKNPKELSNIQHEISNFKNLNDPLENKALEIIDQVEAAEKMVAALTVDYAKLEAEWHLQQKQLAADIELLKKVLAGLRENRNALVDQIELPAVTLYEKIRQQKKLAVSKVEQGICRSCRISLSASALQKARSGQPVLCGSCGRILFIS
jgi:predicted  nucleic acid-binding Zn-ribbon protein